jgi:predicted Rdx family selenoprotein
MNEGEQSQFDVVSEGELVFSKHAEGRFPELADLLAKLR